MNYLNEIQIVPVESGTTFEDPVTGEVHVVTDETNVTHGNRIYCTQKNYDRIRSVTKERDHD